MSAQIRSSTLGLYGCFKASYRYSRSWLKSPVGALYKLYIINLDDLVSSSTAQISICFYLKLHEILTLLQCMSLHTKYTHLSPIDLDARIQHDKAGNLTWWQWTLQSMYIQEAEWSSPVKRPELATEIKQWKDWWSFLKVSLLSYL
jgi:hypothetical protein